MKRMFFVTTVCTLAIAAVSATKANSRINEVGYLENVITGKCTVISGTNCNGTGNTCVDGSGAQLYRFDDANPCTVALQKP